MVYYQVEETTMIKQQFGERLKQYRMARGYSQEKFAMVSGLDRTYIAGIESGKRNITIENAKKIADALSISLADLFDFTKPIHQNFIVTVNGENFILEASKELTRKEKDEIEIIADLAFDEEESSLFDVSDCKSVENLFKVIEEKYKLKQVSLHELYKYFSEYKKDSSLSEITEGYLHPGEHVKIYVRDASTENAFLPDDLRKYDLYVLCYAGKNLISTFYREEFGENEEIINLIETYKCK